MRRVPLVCLPFAGAGASFFFSWGDLAGDDLQVVALQLPGREWRVAEEPYRDVGEAAAGLLPDLLEAIGENRGIVLFGHSLGAVLAYELTRRLAARSDVEVLRLIVSGSPAPWRRRPRRATGLPDDEFLDRVEEFAGYAHEALADRDMRELILPVLRADVEMHENYAPGPQEPLPVPITAVRGRDDALVSAEEAAEWRAATRREFTLAEVAGGHMYLADDPARLLRLASEPVSR